MNRLDITFYLALWGAVTSSILFLFQLLKFRKEYSGNFKMFIVQADEVGIKLRLANSSFRPTSILSYEILYAANNDYHQTILAYIFNDPIKVGESEAYLIELSREDLIRSREEKQIEQHYYHSLKLKVLTSNSGICFYDVIIDESVIKSDYYKPAGQYIATDVYIGFPQNESIYYPVGTKIIMR
jgi:hypothetical protein